MTAPLFDALHALAQRKTVRFHMPGHKGTGNSDFPFPIDFTETYETGNLYSEDGPIRAAELEAAADYKAADCLFLTGGSTQGVMAMLAAVCPPGSSVLLDRNCHRSVCHALALLDLKPHFVFPNLDAMFGCPVALTADTVRDALQAHPTCRAFLMTTPNYYGILTPLAEIAAACRAHGIPLLVDCAHGAHLPALNLPTPIEEGAAACVMSAHKTLPALGQSAFLLSDGTIPRAELRENARLFGTSSPSYPILASLDHARDWLFHTSWKPIAEEANRMREEILASTPFLPLRHEHAAIDPTRLTICTAGTDMTGFELADLLYERFGIAVEMADSRNIVCILTPFDLTENCRRLIDGLAQCGEEAAGRYLPPPPPLLPAPKARMSVREAWFSAHRELPLDEAAGHICARPITPYPPGVPIVLPGEEITAKHIVFLQSVCYNEDCEVVAAHEMPLPATGEDYANQL